MSASLPVADLIVWKSPMPREAEFVGNFVGWVADGVSTAVQAVRSEPRGIKECPVELPLFDLESGGLA